LSLHKYVTPELVKTGARIVVVVYQDKQGKKATAKYCNQYAIDHNIPVDNLIMARDPYYDGISTNKSGATPYHMVLDRDMRIQFTESGGNDAGTPLVYLKSLIKEQNKKDAQAAAQQP
jgi:hypothetical protein